MRTRNDQHSIDTILKFAVKLQRDYKVSRYCTNRRTTNERCHLRRRSPLRHVYHSCLITLMSDSRNPLVSITQCLGCAFNTIERVQFRRNEMPSKGTTRRYVPPSRRDIRMNALQFFGRSDASCPIGFPDIGLGLLHLLKCR